MPLAERIKDIQNSLGLSTTELAEYLGISKSLAYQIEKGEKDREGEPLKRREAIENALIKLESLINSAREKTPGAVDELNRIYEAVQSKLRWSPDVGPVTIGKGLLAAGGLLAPLVGPVGLAGMAVAGLIGGAIGNTLSRPQEGLDEETLGINKVDQLFRRLDRNGDGYISSDELSLALAWPAEERETLFRILDRDKDGALSLGELLKTPLKKPIWDILAAKSLDEALS